MTKFDKELIVCPAKVGSKSASSRKPMDRTWGGGGLKVLKAAWSSERSEKIDLSKVNLMLLKISQRGVTIIDSPSAWVVHVLLACFIHLLHHN